MRAVRFKRNFGQHPAMHAGLVRARGDIVVTMDADLQNVPEDLPRLIAAVEGGADVASGRRRGPGRLLGPDAAVQARSTACSAASPAWTSPTSAAPSTRTPARPIEPVLGVIGKQKFTKALVLSAGASVVEVDLSHQARADGSRYSPFRLDPARAARPRRVLAAADPVGRCPHRRDLRPAHRCAVGVWGIVVWVVQGDFPGLLFLGGLVLGVLAVQGFILALVGEYLGRIQRDVEGRPLYTIERRARRLGGLRNVARRSAFRQTLLAVGLTREVQSAPVRKRILVTGGAGFISSNFIRHLLTATPHDVVSLDALTYAGNVDNLADVMGHERLSFVHGDIRDRALVAEIVCEVDVIVERSRRVARGEVHRRGRPRVRDHERRGDADPPRRRCARIPWSASSSSRRARCTGRPSASPWTRSTRSTRAARTRRRRPAPTGSRTRTTSPTGSRS